MSVRFISGKPGGGKTLYSVHLIYDELRFGRRNIVTNVALDIPAFAEFLHAEHDETFHLRERVHILNEDEAGEFWLHYGTGLKLTEWKTVTLGNRRKVEHLDYSPRFQDARPNNTNSEPTAEFIPAQGVLYVIDEVHEFFNARRWADTGEDALHYLSQHRKLGDDVICITQSIGNVDKQFRSVAQDFTYVRNHGKESLPLLGGLIRSLPLFSRQTYLEPYTGAPGQRPMEIRTFKLNVEGLASCYQTASGVGLLGRGADIGERKKGLNPVWLAVIAALFVFGCFTLPDLLAKKVAGNNQMQKMFGNAPVTGIASGSPGMLSNTNMNFKATLPSKTGQAAEEPKALAESSAPVYLTGVSLWNGKLQIYLSDGRRYSSDDSDVNFVSREMAIIGGKRYMFAPPHASKDKRNWSGDVFPK